VYFRRLEVLNRLHGQASGTICPQKSSVGPAPVELHFCSWSHQIHPISILIISPTHTPPQLQNRRWTLNLACTYRTNFIGLADWPQTKTSQGEEETLKKQEKAWLNISNDTHRKPSESESLRLMYSSSDSVRSMIIGPSWNIHECNEKRANKSKLNYFGASFDIWIHLGITGVFSTCFGRF
jgi:hypothetical protein